MNSCLTSGEIKIFLHHIYEYQKGVRRMVLCTLSPADAEFAVSRLNTLHIDYFLQELNNHNINLFFGQHACIEVIRLIIKCPLNRLSPEEDFILGALLGYDLCLQSDRYCKRKTTALNRNFRPVE